MSMASIKAQKGRAELTWPYRMQEHPDGPSKLSSQQVLEMAMAPNSPYTRIGFGGPKGGGKSYGARAMAFYLAYEYGIVVVLVRSRLTSLKRNHILPAKNELRDWLDAKIVDYNEQDKIFYMPSGGMVQFMYCATMGDIDLFEGVAADVYIFEEAGHFNPEMIRGIMKNNRSSDIAINRGVKYRPRCLFTFNWGGPGHSLLRRWFWDREFEENENQGKFLPLIFAPLAQNLKLLEADPEYPEKLAELPAQLRDAYLKGDPDAFVGTMFTILKRYHEVDPYTILAPYNHDVPRGKWQLPEEWRLIASLDAGVGAPCSFGLYALTPQDPETLERKLYKIFTYKDKRPSGPAHVEAIMERLENCPWTGGRMPEFIVADKFAFQELNNMGVAGGDITWEDLFAKHHLPLYQVSYRRITAIMALQTALHFEIEDQTLELSYEPMLQFFEGENDEAIKELQAAIRSDVNPEDIHKNAEDHVIDEMKNMVLCSESPPAFVVVKKARPEDRNADYGSRVDRMMDILGLGRNSKRETFRNTL